MKELHLQFFKFLLVDFTNFDNSLQREKTPNLVITLSNEPFHGEV